MVFAISGRKKKLVFKSCGGEPHSEYRGTSSWREAISAKPPNAKAVEAMHDSRVIKPCEPPGIYTMMKTLHLYRISTSYLYRSSIHAPSFSAYLPTTLDSLSGV